MHRTGRSWRPVFPGPSESIHTGAAQELGLHQNEGPSYQAVLSGNTIFFNTVIQSKIEYDF